MGGVRMVDGELVVDRRLNELDRLALSFSSILDDLDIGHVFVSGYVALLAGRARSTEDIDVILEPLDDETVDRLVDRLVEAKLWGPAMPLETLHDVEHDHIWVARTDEIAPRLDVKFADDRFDRSSLENRFDARLSTADATLPIGPLELQIAYKLWMVGQRDFEDALYLYDLLGETLSTPELEHWVDELEVHEAYDRLRSA
ncbi:MAG: hypothetical protein U5J98_05975 [Halobacteriales archaeon]|nr:hypothetical protein [Halobacteriales archaeon]